jgi:hypothetical protein
MFGQFLYDLIENSSWERKWEGSFKIESFYQS